MGHHSPMAHKPRKAPSLPKTGKTVAVLGERFVLVQVGASTKKVRAGEAATVLVSRAGQALKKPGIGRETVFKPGQGSVFAFSVDPSDPDRVIREAADGSRQTGRLVNGRFLAVKAAA